MRAGFADRGGGKFSAGFHVWCAEELLSQFETTKEPYTLAIMYVGMSM